MPMNTYEVSVGQVSEDVSTYCKYMYIHEHYYSHIYQYTVVCTCTCICTCAVYYMYVQCGILRHVISQSKHAMPIKGAGCALYTYMYIGMLLEEQIYTLFCMAPASKCS